MMVSAEATLGFGGEVESVNRVWRATGKGTSLNVLT